MLFTCKRLCGHWNFLLLVKQVLAFMYHTVEFSPEVLAFLKKLAIRLSRASSDVKKMIDS